MKNPDTRTPQKTGNLSSVALLAKAVQELSLARDMEAVADIVRKAARQLTGADGATFILREGDNCHYLAEDAISPLWKGKRFPMNSCISGWAMLKKERVMVADIYSDDRIPHEAYRPTFVKSLAIVPIRSLEPIGAIGNYWSRSYHPDETELALLQSLADVTAVTIENIKVYTELELRVDQRTRELESVNKELESFSYSVSHDLRAPLRAINGYLGILLKDHAQGLDEEGRRLASRVIANAGQMTKLIEVLLDFFSMGKKELTKTRVNMKLMANEICNSFSEAQKDRRLEFRVEDLPEAFGDPGLLRQVWFNLISNAVKYASKKDRTRIEIGHLKEDPAVYFVKDNGDGFDMNYYDRLFGVFQRLHSRQEFEGSGIGLAIVQKIISRHGGRVWAEAVEREGATFYFTLGGG